jgi:hypothetical protein
LFECYAICKVREVAPSIANNGLDRAGRRLDDAGQGLPMAYSLGEAAAAAGINKSSVLRAIRRGAISADKDPATGQWSIEPAELHRVYPAANGAGAAQPSSAAGASARNAVLEAELSGLRARLDDALATVADLRARLDSAEAERRAERERNAALLTDQRAPRGWFRWGRG